ncbi:hypothetical protein [Maribacter antarcticus]|uniref:hypothetical protein n=1 Tax=Maribacter antarcticus TaxID=505250 RepID=UPI00068639BC|nr:hypothetical protein [Maribacter antarcticus]
MKKILYILPVTFGTSLQFFSQERLLSPLNNTTVKSFVNAETSEMNWFMLKDSLKIQIGNVQTVIQKEKESIYIITTVNMKKSPTKWVDSTIVETLTFTPLYLFCCLPY